MPVLWLATGVFLLSSGERLISTLCVFGSFISWMILIGNELRIKKDDNVSKS